MVRTRKAQAKADPAEGQRREQAARLRGAQEREARIKAALAQLPEVAATKKRNGGKAEEARVSTPDPDARVMKMGDGGFRPAVNVQFATTCEDQVIVGMAVVNAGSDMAQLAPMVEQVQQRLDQSPAPWMVDGGLPAHEQLDAVSGKTEVYAPVPEPKVKRRRGQSAGADRGQIQAQAKRFSRGGAMVNAWRAPRCARPWRTLRFVQHLSVFGWETFILTK